MPAAARTPAPVVFRNSRRLNGVEDWPPSQSGQGVVFIMLEYASPSEKASEEIEPPGLRKRPQLQAVSAICWEAVPPIFSKYAAPRNCARAATPPTSPPLLLRS